jgi:hypothetical protein
MKFLSILTLVYLIRSFESLISIKETNLYLKGEKLKLNNDISSNIQIVYFIQQLNGHTNKLNLETILSLDEHFNYLANFKIQTALVIIAILI